MGLVNSLLLVYYVLEMRTPDHAKNYDFETQVFDVYEQSEIPDTEVCNAIKVKVELISVKTPITSIKPTNTSLTAPIFDTIEIVSDDTELQEAVIGSSEVEEKEAIAIEGVYYKDIEEVIIEEEVIEDVPFMIIEKAPVFPGCKGNNKELKRCLEQSIRDYVAKNFNTELAKNLGLSTGTKRIFVMFVIDKNGQIISVKSRAPHKRLQIEAERVVRSLPIMKPGEQRGKPVGVKYSLPIVFMVQ